MRILSMQNYEGRFHGQFLEGANSFQVSAIGVGAGLALPKEGPASSAPTLLIADRSLVQPVVRSFLRDDDVVDVALTQAGRGDADEAAVPAEFLDGVTAAISHAGSQPPPQLV